MEIRRAIAWYTDRNSQAFSRTRWGGGSRERWRSWSIARARSVDDGSGPCARAEPEAGAPRHPISSQSQRRWGDVGRGKRIRTPRGVCDTARDALPLSPPEGRRWRPSTSSNSLSGPLSMAIETPRQIEVDRADGLTSGEAAVHLWCDGGARSAPALFASTRQPAIPRCLHHRCARYPTVRKRRRHGHPEMAVLGQQPLIQDVARGSQACRPAIRASTSASGRA